nr:hypothetical protein [uncultured Rhodopila sp.]
MNRVTAQSVCDSSFRATVTTAAHQSDTTRRRTHSLLHQGIMLFQLVPRMPEHRLLPLIEKSWQPPAHGDKAANGDDAGALINLDAEQIALVAVT